MLFCVLEWSTAERWRNGVSITLRTSRFYRQLLPLSPDVYRPDVPPLIPASFRPSMTTYRLQTIEQSYESSPRTPLRISSKSPTVPRGVERRWNPLPSRALRSSTDRLAGIASRPLSNALFHPDRPPTIALCTLLSPLNNGIKRNLIELKKETPFSNNNQNEHLHRVVRTQPVSATIFCSQNVSEDVCSLRCLIRRMSLFVRFEMYASRFRRSRA